MQKVSFHFNNVSFSLKERMKLKSFLEKLFTKEKRSLDRLVYIFCSDDELLSINKSFLAHDYYTDIITFDLSEGDIGITGEIYISIDRVKDNAKDLGESITRELHRVIFHGALHLCGYKDKSKKDQTLMRAKEDYYLNQYFK